MSTRRIVTVIGTRPEAIKMAPVIRAIQERRDELESVVIATAQHREMLDQVLDLLQIVPDLDLDLMRPDQSLTDLTARVLREMEKALEKTQPDLLLVQGDTTTVFAGALAAFYAGVPVGHVEAGLRSRDLRNPFPEELNRHLTSVVTDIHFAPTEKARRELLREAIPEERIVVTGNTVVDALLSLRNAPFSFDSTPLADFPFEDGRLLLVTSHRRESWGAQLEEICLALKDLTALFSDLQVIYPVHLNPNVRRTVEGLLQGQERIHLIPPVDYLTFIHLMQRSFLILTDSGGVQEEAPSLRKPLLVLRKVTERTEALESGQAKVVGTSRESIVEESARLLTDPKAYRAMTTGPNPFGDGHAAERIAETLGRWARGALPLLEPERQFHPQMAQAKRTR